MKLYARYPRLRYCRQCDGAARRKIRWTLGLKVGDLINDCTAFNVVIKEIIPRKLRSKRGWAIVDVDFVTSAGACSLLNCGVEPPLDRETLEKRFLDWFGGDWIDWHCRGDLDSPWAQEHRAKIATLESGGHLLDERGVLLKP